MIKKIMFEKKSMFHRIFYWHPNPPKTLQVCLGSLPLCLGKDNKTISVAKHTYIESKKYHNRTSLTVFIKNNKFMVTKYN